MTKMVLPRKQLLVMVLNEYDKGYSWRVIQGNCLLERSKRYYFSFHAAYAAGQRMSEFVIPIFPIALPDRNSLSYGYMVDVPCY
jgi:hypothetical protein